MRLRTDLRQHTTDGRTGRFTIAESPHWVNVLPVTTSGDIVLVEQFRHGTGTVSLEIPGGVVDINEDPLDAAERECLEETGWKGRGRAELLGTIEPNPAFMSNVCSVYIWNNCTLAGNQHLDPLEDINVVVVSVQEFFQRISHGTICHSLVLSAVALALVKSRLSSESIGRING